MADPPSYHAAPARPSVQGVLVLYRRTLDQSSTWSALRAQIDGRLRSTLDFHLLVCDNGPVSPAQRPEDLPDWVEYIAAEQNRGLAWAYNLGLARGLSRGAEWLLTLDQDTALPPEYLLRLAALAADLAGTQAEHSRPIAAIVPQLAGEHGTIYSPVFSHWYGECKVPLGYRGRGGGGEVRAFNSAALLRTQALQAVGGYDPRFWLNYLDHAIFHALQQAGYAVWIAGDLQIRHHLSLEEGRGQMSEQHFLHFSATESAFRDLHGGRLEGMLFTARLFGRVFNQKRRGDPGHFARATRRVLRERLTLPRAERVRRWEARVAPLAEPPSIAWEIRGTGSEALP